ncbi:UPF0481 protein At3g47200-like [Olea europaea var. sylvestris]|uniref:UPF0481 protein At3g47200-like n=1 Tax=Olea europaea var. sylvestris TaxID=158386 RepID=UPI000C1D095C|nr:UPF0481 protein At3g47200-like [Olea europaea var. sylvestris]
MSTKIHANIQGMTTVGTKGDDQSANIQGMTTVGTKGDNQSAEITQIDTKSQESNNSISKDDPVENYVDNTTDKPQIQRVPSLLRDIQSNDKCYDPLVVSIGPYHHGNPQLESFENLKIPVAHKFIRACGNQVSYKQLYEEVAKVGESARKCYEKGSTEKYDDESFNKMMFLDACFVLQIILSKTNSNQTGEDLLGPWAHHLVFARRGLFLLENRIPLLVLKVLIKFRQNKLIGSSPEDKKGQKCFKCLLHLLPEWLIGSSPEDKNEEKFVEWYSYRSVTELESAGIHFRPSQTDHFTDVKFKSHLLSYTLTLCPIVVEDSAKSLLLNLAAYEMCPNDPSDYRIMSYICLMDSLIDHADDVKEFRKRKILLNSLGSDEELARLFNEISNNVVYDNDAYRDVKMQIEKHCQSKAQVWMAEWIHNHFRSP